MKLLLSFLIIRLLGTTALIPFIDGGKGIPKIYQGYFDEQIAKQACTAVAKAIAAGKTNLEVNFPPVPNVEEVRFGTPLNKKFGEQVVEKGLNVKGKYKPGSNLSRQLLAYSNIYWAKQMASVMKGGIVGGKPVSVLSSEQVNVSDLQSKGDMSFVGPLNAVRTAELRSKSSKGAVILVNPGGEETWEKVRQACGNPTPFLILNNAYSTSYDLGNKCGYEEAYYLKRISRGWVFRAFPGPWEAYLEKPDGSCELLKAYKEKPTLKEVATIVRDESFSRYAIGNDRWMSGRM
jgi:hypothetical protein